MNHLRRRRSAIDNITPRGARRIRHGYLSLAAILEIAAVLAVLAAAVIGLPYAMDALVGLPGGDAGSEARQAAVYDVTEWTPEETIYYRGLNGMLGWLDLASGVHERIALPPGVDVTAVTRSAHSGMLAMGLGDGRVFVERQPGGGTGLLELRPRGMTQGKDTITALQFSRDGRRLAAGSDLGVICIWDVAGDGIERMQLSGHIDSVLCLRWLPDGRLISTARDAACWLWDVEHGQLVRVFAGHADTVFSAAVSSDGRLLLTAGKDRTVRAWEIESGRPLWSTELGLPWITEVVLHPTGPAACGAAPSEGSIWLLDRHTGRVLRQLPGHATGVSAMHLDTEGRRLVTAGYDGGIHLWQAGPQADDWQLLRTYDFGRR